VAEARVIPWDGGPGPTEDQIREIYRTEELVPSSWASGLGDVYAPHQHDYHKVIYVVRGSITFGLPASGAALELRAGDRLELPAGVVHEALVGPAGVVCLEAHKYK
jgi:uncharacterized protein YjlB